MPKSRQSRTSPPPPQGVSFKRLVLQFRTANQDVRQVVERMARCVDLDTQCPYRFGESGDVIAQVSPVCVFDMLESVWRSKCQALCVSCRAFFVVVFDIFEPEDWAGDYDNEMPYNQRRSRERSGSDKLVVFYSERFLPRSLT